METESLPPVLPAEEYRQRLQARELEVARLQAVNERISGLRLLIFVATALAAWGSLQFELFSLRWLLAPAALFIGVAVHHSGVRRARTRAERTAAVYKRGLARIEDRWMGQGQTGERFNDGHHVYAADLDLFGKGSLFELLSTARTRMGENALARWLLSPAPAEEIRERQAAVAELRQLLDLREELAVMGEDKDIGVQPDALLKWAEAPNLLTRRWLPWAAALLPLLALAGAVVWNRWGLASPFLLVVVVEAGVLQIFGKQLHGIVYGTENAFDDLKLLAALPARLEREPFKSPHLQRLVGRLASHGIQASRTIARLATVVQMVESRRNPILALLQIPLMYPLHVALAAERWRRDHGAAVRSWLEVLGEIEALISLSAYSYEHPEDPFPEFVDGPASLQGELLGHPLIPAASCVRNDVGIAGKTRALLISGSNMSGKSTLMRTVGINTVLAMAGGPVRAQRLQLTALQVGASIRVNDSLHEGSSRFYAEITRLRQLHELSLRNHPLPNPLLHRDVQMPRAQDARERPPLEAREGTGRTGGMPLLFLLDEVLQGTNSRDRRIGAEGVVRAFLEQGSIGMISTHDLALTDIEVGGGERLRNMHFQDELVDGQMKFDFKLREGVVTKSNGIELMRSIGLRV